MISEGAIQNLVFTFWKKKTERKEFYSLWSILTKMPVLMEKNIWFWATTSGTNIWFRYCSTPSPLLTFVCWFEDDIKGSIASHRNAYWSCHFFRIVEHFQYWIIGLLNIVRWCSINCQFWVHSLTFVCWSEDDRKGSMQCYVVLKHSNKRSISSSLVNRCMLKRK